MNKNGFIPEGYVRYVLIFLLFLLVNACTHTPSSYQSSTLTDTVSIRYAKGFRIIRTEYGFIAEVFNPWQQAQNITFKYKLTRKNTFDSSSHIRNTINIDIPVSKIVCLSSTHVGFVDVLGKTSTIKGISGINNVYNPAIIRSCEQGNIFEAGYENNLNYEKIIKTKPDVVFAYGIGSESSGYFVKLEELGIPVVLVGEYLEQHPLARTEWLKFFGVFFDQLELAEKIFRQTDSLYHFWQKKGQTYTFRPVVMTALPWNGNWYISGAKTYMAQLIKDAGGKYAWDDLQNNISIPIDIETVFQRCRNADYWINIGQATNKTEILNTDRRLSLFRPFQTGNLYNNIARVSHKGGNDYWESGAIKPHLILSDMVKIFHPGDSQSDSLYFFVKLK
ncbi:MAG: ABC transporter substrate-binding protein [Bacteroidales bacterium]|nr:ABC transporter substrate-binding protein [Bacteroidales bacterium]